MLAEGESLRDSGEHLLSSLVLVDITPRVDYEGVAKVQGFMRAHAKEGFATIDEAADAVAEYLPHRPRPKSNEGLKKNLRLSPDGRWRWHWDPRFMDGRRRFDPTASNSNDRCWTPRAASRFRRCWCAAAHPNSCRRRMRKEFLELVPHAEYVDVADARHMVAGDRNDHFSTAVMDFLAARSQAA